MEIAKYIVCFIFVLLATISDYKTFKIRNKLVLIFLIVGFILNISNSGFEGLKDSFFGCIFPLVLFPLFALKMLGAGDVKAFCAIGSIVGLKQGIYTILFSFIAGGIIAIIFMLLRKNAFDRFKKFLKYIKMCFYMRKLLPYDEFSDENSKFRFAYGILGGYILIIYNTFLR